MAQVLLQVAITPVLIALSFMAAQRWGERAGGLVSAFPAVAGPFLLLVADQDGARTASSTANATLAGLLALSGFAVTYARAARHHDWVVSLAMGWGVAAGLAPVGALLASAAPIGVLLATASLAWAWRAIPRGQGPEESLAGGGRMLSSMALGALLVLVLPLSVRAMGPQIGGALAGLPVIATVLAVGVHRVHGARATATLLRGMIAGMIAFVTFCEIVALFVVSGGVARTFSLATAAALACSYGLALRPHARRRAV